MEHLDAAALRARAARARTSTSKLAAAGVSRWQLIANDHRRYLRSRRRFETDERAQLRPGAVRRAAQCRRAAAAQGRHQRHRPFRVQRRQPGADRLEGRDAAVHPRRPDAATSSAWWSGSWRCRASRSASPIRCSPSATWSMPIAAYFLFGEAVGVQRWSASGSSSGVYMVVDLSSLTRDTSGDRDRSAAGLS